MVAELRVEAHQLDLGGERRAGQRQHLVDDVRQRQQRRPDVERGAVVAHRASLPPVTRVALEDLHAMAGGSQADRHGEAADARPDDDDVASATAPPAPRPRPSGSIAAPPTERDEAVAEERGEAERLHRAHERVLGDERGIGSAAGSTTSSSSHHAQPGDEPPGEVDDGMPR